MGSKTFFGVWFTSYSDDHPPPHVHAQQAGIEVVIDLLPGGKVRQSIRPDCVKPPNAKRSQVKRMLRVAAEHAPELLSIWEQAHGSAAN